MTDKQTKGTMLMAVTANKRKKAIAATVAAAAILLAGTFAWTSISQQAKNEAIVDINPGGRLHDDFNGTNKDVYVENFNSKDDINAVPIYARIRLDEYMEIGQEAGKKDITDDERLADSVAEGGDINNVSTWQTYIPGEDTVENNDPFRKYWTWDLGNSSTVGRYYMPTFDKNKDSLDADINGTYQGPDGTDGEVEGDTADRYGDYKEYGPTSTETADEFYDWDSDTNHETDEKNNFDNQGIKPYDETLPIDSADVVRKEKVLHRAEPITKTAEVITMAQWLDPDGTYRGKPGDYWVYDTDGWAYWANPIMPGETTGLLLDGIRMHKKPDDSWYYGINVVAQFATAGDFSGFTREDTITDEALELLSVVSGMKDTFSIEGPEKVSPSGTYNYSVVLKKAGVTVSQKPQATWSVEATAATEGISLFHDVQGVTIDSSSGQLTVADTAVGGITFNVVATMEDGTIIKRMVTIESEIPLEDNT